MSHPLIRSPEQLPLADPRIAVITPRLIVNRLVPLRTTGAFRVGLESDVDFDCHDAEGRYLGVLSDEAGRQYAAILAGESNHAES